MSKTRLEKRELIKTVIKEDLIGKSLLGKPHLS